MPVALDTFDVFSIHATTGHLMMKASNINNPNGPDDGWYDLGGLCAGAPVAVFYDAAKTYNVVYVIGMDGAMWGCYYDGNGKCKFYSVPAARFYIH